MWAQSAQLHNTRTALGQTAASTDLLVVLEEDVLALLVLLREGQEALVVEQRLVRAQLQQLGVRRLVGYSRVVAAQIPKTHATEPSRGVLYFPSWHA